MEDVEDLLLQLEQELNEGKKSLFGGGVTVDAETMYGIIDRIRAALPEMIREAKYIVQTNEKRRQEETLRAQNLIQAAQARADEMLNEHAIIQQVQREADAIRAQAMDYKAQVERKIRQELTDLLAETESVLSDALNIIHRSQLKYDNR